MENALTSYYQKVAPAGSAFYYSLLPLPEEKKNAIVAIAAFYAEIATCITDCEEPTIARVKYQWWRMEVAKLHLGQPEHPITRLLQQAVNTYHLAPQDFMDIIDHSETLLDHPTFATLSDMQRHILHTAGRREYLMARIIHPDADIALESFSFFAELLEFADQIQRLRQHIQQESLLLCEEELTRFQMSLPMLQAMKSTPEIVNWLHFRHQSAETAYRLGLANLTPPIQRQYIHTIMHCELALKLLQAIQSSHYQVLEHWITLPALRLWWAARRIYRRKIV